MKVETGKQRQMMEYVNIGEFNRGKSSVIIHGLVREERTALIQKNGKPIAVMISYERYQRLFEQGIDLAEY